MAAKPKKRDKNKKPDGPPTKYKPEYCQALLDHMGEGLSYGSFAGVLKVHRDTLYEWEKKHSEWKHAKEVGESMSLLQWERTGIKGVRGLIQGFSVAGWIYNMKNRFGWRDKQKDEVDQVNVNVSSMSDDELVKIVRTYLHEKAKDV